MLIKKNHSENKLEENWKEESDTQYTKSTTNTSSWASETFSE